MATKGASAKRPRGDKRTRAAIERHLAIVDLRWTSGTPRYAIEQELGKRGVAPTTVHRLIQRAERRWREEAEVATPERRAQRIARVTMLSEETRKAGKYASCARFEHMLNEMFGVYAPEQHEVRGAIAVAEVAAPSVDLSKASDAVLDELERLADGAITAPAGLIGDTTVAS